MYHFLWKRFLGSWLQMGDAGGCAHTGLPVHFDAELMDVVGLARGPQLKVPVGAVGPPPDVAVAHCGAADEVAAAAAAGRHPDGVRPRPQPIVVPETKA
jgi:hypothetical protein